MPIYLAHRTVVESSEEDLEAAFVRAKEAADQMPEVRWIRSYYSAEEGKIYCEYEAPSVEAIVEHARRVGIPFDHAEVVWELEPGMFA
jgi:Nickel responsive protein SCO4226-like